MHIIALSYTDGEYIYDLYQALGVLHIITPKQWLWDRGIINMRIGQFGYSSYRK